MNDAAVVPTPEAQQALATVQVIENRVQTYVPAKITTPEIYRDVGEELVRVKTAQKRLDEVRKAMTKPLDAAKSAIMDFFRAPAARLTDAEDKIKAAIRVYDREQDELRAKEQREADERARKEREFNEQRAARAAEQGRMDDAAQLQAAAAQVTAPVIVREAPSVKGVSLREGWKFEIVDESLIPREFLVVDQAKIRGVVQAMKGGTNIPGVRAYSEKQVVGSSGRF